MTDQLPSAVLSALLARSRGRLDELDRMTLRPRRIEIPAECRACVYRPTLERAIDCPREMDDEITGPMPRLVAH